MANITQGLIASLDNIDEQLDGLIDFIDNTSPYLQDVANSAGNLAQDAVDDAMDKISDSVSEKLQPLRDKLVEVLHSQYQEVQSKLNQYIAPISSFVTIDWTTGQITPNIQPNLDTLKSFAEGIIQMLVPSQAVMFVVNYTTQVMPKVTSISNKILQVASYQLEIPELPDITIPQLDIDVDPITISDITG